MDREEGLDRIRTVLADCLELDEDDIRADSSLIAELGVDSLDLVDVIFSLEEEFGIKMRDADFDLLSKLDVSNPEVVEGGLMTAEALSSLTPFVPQLSEMQDGVTPRQLFDVLSVETLWLVIDYRIRRSG